MSFLNILQKVYTKFGFQRPIFFKENGKTYMRCFPFGIPVTLRWKLNKFQKLFYFDKYERELTADEQRYCIEQLFQNFVGYIPNIDSPRTFNEKIQWLKLYYHDPLMTECADKVRVREYVKKIIGEKYLTQCYGIYSNPEEIDFSSLPDKFVLKVNWGCGQNIICQDKSVLNVQSVKRQLTQWMQPAENNYFVALEWIYKDISPLILCEEYLENSFNNLNDYKVFCFGGKAYYIMYLTERNTDGLKMAFYNLQWEKQEFTYSHPVYDKNVPPPQNLDLLIRLAEKLATGFPHVRVDFYQLNDGSLKFGELTFTSLGGYCDWRPKDMDLKMGDLLVLPSKKI